MTVGGTIGGIILGLVLGFWIRKKHNRRFSSYTMARDHCDQQETDTDRNVYQTPQQHPTFPLRDIEMTVNVAYGIPFLEEDDTGFQRNARRNVYSKIGTSA